MAIRQPRQTRIKPPTRPKWQSKYHGVRMTPEEYLALPEDKPYLEYVDGVVLQKPMPNEDHGELAAELILHLKLWMKTHKGRLGPEVRARLGELPNFRLPDISYWKPGIPRGNESPPTLAVEIRSKDQTLAELRRKCEFLRSTGVEACWLIDPFSRKAEQYEGARKGAPIEVLNAACLPGFALPLVELFAVIEDSGE
jgi:Uma2 family endonuclease